MVMIEVPKEHLEIWGKFLSEAFASLNKALEIDKDISGEARIKIGYAKENIFKVKMLIRANIK
ncbi:hypothetical protein J4414_03280 [Candidatus Woesearchaeota archaeon]|nr:hypothetical protein [Candidatus Woesearchaeota archaeon]